MHAHARTVTTVAQRETRDARSEHFRAFTVLFSRFPRYYVAVRYIPPPLDPCRGLAFLPAASLSAFNGRHRALLALTRAGVFSGGPL